MAYLVATLQTVIEGLGRGTLGALQSPQLPPLEELLTALLNEVSAASEPIVLILDDYHLIHAQAIRDALAFTIDHLPSRMHVVIATRTDPPLPVARLRGRGQVTELRQADLRFTVEETTEFLDLAAGLDLDRDQIAVLDSRTEGWPAGLQMAAVSMRGREDLTGFVEALDVEVTGRVAGTPVPSRCDLGRWVFLNILSDPALGGY